MANRRFEQYSYGLIKKAVHLVGKAVFQDADKASVVIQDVTFTAATAGPDGNNITIEYENSGGTKATRTAQDIEYEAALAGSAGNDISIEYLDTAARAVLVIQDITYTFLTEGVEGNGVTIAYTDTVLAGSELLTNVGPIISIAIQSGVSTATQVKAAFDAALEVPGFIAATITGTAGTAQVAAAAASMAGGADVVATVVGTAISVAIEDGFTSATKVKAAIDAESDATDLVTATITGTASDAQEIYSQNLDDGGYPLITVVDTAITVNIDSGGSGAGSVVAAITGDVGAAALVEAEVTGDDVAQVTQGETNLENGHVEQVVILEAPGISSITIDDPGVYIINLEDEYQTLLSADISLQKATAADLIAQVKYVDIGVGSAKQLVFKTLAAATATSLLDGDIIYMHLVLRNGSIT